MLDCKKLEEKIQQSGKSQRELASIIGISEALLTYIKKGFRDPSLAVAGRLARALGSTIDELLKEDN